MGLPTPWAYTQHGLTQPWAYYTMGLPTQWAYPHHGLTTPWAYPHHGLTHTMGLPTPWACPHHGQEMLIDDACMSDNTILSHFERNDSYVATVSGNLYRLWPEFTP
jgi:hypothetical protein